MFVQIRQRLDEGDGILLVVTISYALLTGHTAQENLTMTSSACCRRGSKWDFEWGGGGAGGQ